MSYGLSHQYLLIFIAWPLPSTVPLQLVTQRLRQNVRSAFSALASKLSAGSISRTGQAGSQPSYTYQLLHWSRMDKLRAFQPKLLKCLTERVPTFQRFKHSWSYVVLNTWSMEIIAISFSIACLIAIFTVLLVFDNSPAPQIRYGLTLNTIVSTLAAAAKSSLICGIAGSIGQLKWCSFTTGRRKLQNLQIFDDASRGPLGALSVLGGFSWFRLVSVASLITVLAVAFEPFVQQVLTYPVHYVDHGKHHAVATKASTFNPSTSKFAHILDGVVGGYEDSSPRDPACSSGNCTWPTFESLAWCSKCEDITHIAEAAAKKCDFQRLVFDPGYPSLLCHFAFDGGESRIFARGEKLVSFNGSYGFVHSHVNATEEAIWTLTQGGGFFLDGHTALARNKSFLGVQSPFLALARVSLNPVFPSNPRLFRAFSTTPTSLVKAAEECILSPCIRKYEITTTNGVTSSRILSENYGLVTGRKSFDFCWQSKPGIHPHILKRPSYNAICPFDLWSSPISDRLSASQWLSQDFKAGNESLASQNNRNYGTNGRTLEQISRQHKNLTAIVGNIAESLTRLTLQHSDETVIGKAKVPRTYVHVRWAWLILPVALEAAGVVLLTLTILNNRREKVPGLWKSSLLPLLYHGLDERLIDDEIGADVAEMDEKAEKMVVQLATNPKTRRIVLAAT